VASAFGRKLLGYCLWQTPRGDVKRAVAEQAIETFRRRVRRMTKRSGGRSMVQVAEELKGYVPGWKAYFRLAQTPGVLRKLDEWLRHRLRALQLNQWRRGTTTYRALRALGATSEQAARIAAHERRWWHNSRYDLNRVLSIRYFDQLGVPRLS
jgi:RNA-directed DNA polymerase